MRYGHTGDGDAWRDRRTVTGGILPRSWAAVLALWLPILTGLLLVTVVFSVSTGSADLTFGTVWKVIFSKIPWLGGHIVKDWNQATEIIIWQIRMPRILLGILIGGALAAAGTAYQGVLRNPLADPYILGVSSGSSLGAAVVILLGWQSSTVLGQWSLPLAAFVMGMLTLAAVYRLAGIRGRLQMETLILSGVVVQAFIAAALSFLLALSQEKMQQIVFWMMGSLTLSDWSYSGVILPCVGAGILVIWAFSKPLNALALGEDSARHLGVSVDGVRIIVLLAASLVTGAAVAVSGTIGFVGLVIPHIVRLAFGSDHRVVLPLSVVCGAVFLTCADTLARILIEPRELPVGIFTAFLGAPFFGYLLRRTRKSTNFGG